MNAEYSKYEILQWIYNNIPLGSKIAMNKDFGSFGLYVSKDLYDIELIPTDVTEFQKNNFDYLFINYYDQQREKYPDLYNFLDNQPLLKKFRGPARFIYGLSIYKIQKKKHLTSLRFALVKHNPREGDFAGFKTVFQGELGTKYIFKANIFDGYPHVYKNCPIIQQIIINDRVVWSHSIADPKLTTGWNESTVEFIQRRDPTEIITGVWATGPEIPPWGWGDFSKTLASTIIINEDGVSLPVKWEFVERNGRRIQHENFYTKTLHIPDYFSTPDRNKQKIFPIKNQSFEKPRLTEGWGVRLMRSANIFKDFFKFRLKHDNPQKGDFAGISTSFNGTPNETYTFEAYIKDKYEKSGGEGRINQQILINDKVMWSHDICDKKGSGWNKATINFLQGKEPSKIEIKVAAIGNIPPYGYGKVSTTSVVPNILSDKGIKAPVVKWEFIGNSIHIIEPNEGDQHAFEDHICKITEIGNFWLDETKGFKSAIAERTTEVFTDGEHALHLQTFENSNLVKTTLQVGQVLSEFEKDSLADFSIDYYIDSHQTKGKNAKVNMRFIAKSLGGKILKERTYTIYDAKAHYSKPYFFDRWHTFSKNIKKDFSHIFMNWKSIAFNTIIIEIESDFISSVNVYFDNIKPALTDQSFAQAFGSSAHTPESSNVTQ